MTVLMSLCTVASVLYRWRSNIDLVPLDLCHKLTSVRGRFSCNLLSTVKQDKETSALLSSVDEKSDKQFQIDWIAAIVFTAAGVLVLLELKEGSTEEWVSAIISCDEPSILVIKSL
ncbi:hypothetical protein NEOLEDRAFT_801712 [Neolentinus lepideus HHB14362 ss-1]|uniref:Uncharacterized protein n=1 Tax=Neolentinus lepideus HHB14362 ss-1 TaxID=1314782 RepID=A0A165PI94_9AGAM|nr:hypothetical protein NEOLEDRAFT_801712 [Neolentinus lepideus HHB14362 ss-1]